MKELSLNILDIAENSAKAGARNIRIALAEDGALLTIVVSDDGCGMKPDLLKRVTDPFTTTRTTRKVGLGIPLFKLAAEQTGGTLEIVSKHISDFPEDHGTVVTAVFHKDHIDCTPHGDIVSTMLTLVQGHPDIDFLFTHEAAGAPCGWIRRNCAKRWWTFRSIRTRSCSGSAIIFANSMRKILVCRQCKNDEIIKMI